MKDWNVVVTAYREGHRHALRSLRSLCRTEPSAYYNVILAAAGDPMALLEELERRAETEPVLIDTISRVAPAMAVFDYASDEEFERQATATALAWLPRLAGKSFHVRVHRRGAGLTVESHVEEARLGEKLLAALTEAGTPGKIGFDDPDLILAVDAIDGRAGLGLWSREDLARHRFFLRPD